jgi:hypothetical protein
MWNDASFKPDRVKAAISKGLSLAGTPVSRNEAGVIDLASDTSDEKLLNERLRKEDDKSNPNWFDSASAWMYWFRNVSWFADENRLVIYFFKTESGPLVPNFSRNYDNI